MSFKACSINQYNSIFIGINNRYSPLTSSTVPGTKQEASNITDIQKVFEQRFCVFSENFYGSFLLFLCQFSSTSLAPLKNNPMTDSFHCGRWSGLHQHLHLITKHLQIIKLLRLARTFKITKSKRSLRTAMPNAKTYLQASHPQVLQISAEMMVPPLPEATGSRAAQTFCGTCFS